MICVPMCFNKIFMKKIILLPILIFIVQTLNAQQYPLFSNYVLNSYGFNPAIAGSTPHWNALATYRTQWVGIDGAPQTQIVSLHGPVGAFGVGGYFFNDTAGKLQRTGGNGTLTYGLRIGTAGEIRAGVGLNVFRFGPTGDLNNTPEPILMNGMTQTLTDVTAGVYLHLNNGFYIGVSDPQMLGREVDLTGEEGTDRELIPHYYLMSGYQFSVSEKFALEPSVLLKLTEAIPWQYDISLRAIFNQKFWIGGTYRSGAATSGMVGVELTPNIGLAYAYDMTFNDLKEASSGSHEVTLGLKFGLPKDRDEDGVVDKKDKCPDEPGLKELDGCPQEEDEEIADNDQDKDGVLDVDDLCPYTYGSPKNQGCPENSDRDKDGLADAIDKCPDEYGLAIHEGCPITDSDGDLVADENDRCPQTPGEISNFGCPIIPANEKKILDLAIQNLYFDTNHWLIKSESYPSLDKLAQLLVDNPNYRILIEGHTDSVGSAEFNYELSKNRASAVRNYLVNSGASKDQLLVEYYGESKPITSNITEGQRQLNRRVEMKFIWD